MAYAPVLSGPNDPQVVAVVYNDDGTLHDECWTWETGQNFALSLGMRVIAVAADGAMDVQSAQTLYDADRAAYNDCFGDVVL